MTVAEEFPELFHYTDAVGLDGILSSQNLWATHYSYLNDAEELIHAKNILISLLVPKMHPIVIAGMKREQHLNDIVVNSGGPDKFTYQQAELFISALYDSVLGEDLKGKLPLEGPFITAFSAPKDDFVKSNGLLSQWRGYGKDGGYLIEFDTSGLEKMIHEEDSVFFYPVILFADVGYGTNSVRFSQELQEDLKEIEMALASFISETDDYSSVRSFLDKALMPFIRFISCSKHQGFEEEKEVRAVFYPASPYGKEQDLSAKHKQIKSINFCHGKGIMKPYLKINEKKLLPIKRVIVGPHRDQLLRKKSLELRLRDSGILVSASIIPFLG